MTCGFVVSQGLPRQIIWLFLGQEQKDFPAVLALGTHAIRLATLGLPLVGFQVIAANYFQAVGKPMQSMLLTLSRQVILLIPILLVLPHFFGLDGVWGSFPCADLCSSVLTAACLFWELRRLRKSTSIRPPPPYRHPAWRVTSRLCWSPAFRRRGGTSLSAAKGVVSPGRHALRCAQGRATQPLTTILNHYASDTFRPSAAWAASARAWFPRATTPFAALGDVPPNR